MPIRCSAEFRSSFKIFAREFAYNNSGLADGYLMLKILRAILRFADGAITFVAFVCCGSVGVFLISTDVAGGGEGRQAQKRRYIRVTQEQLASVSLHLRDYRKAHGRYPTNDEGLAAIDGFVARQKVLLYRQADREYDRGYSFTPGGYEVDALMFWPRARSCISRFRRDHGRPPATADELLKSGLSMLFELDMPAARGDRPVKTTPEIEAIELELAVGRDDSVFLMSPGGIMSAWRMPFVYENRNGLDGSVLGNSPVDDDDERRYSVKVDRGVYVWSVGARQYDDDVDVLLSPHTIMQCIGGAILLILLGVTWLVLSEGRILAIMGLAASVMVVPAMKPSVSCYLPIRFVAQRSSELVSQRRDLLDKYHGAGAISEETYAKSLEAMGLKSANRADCQSSGGDGKDMK
jgi:hypothetical protein